jgi:hypothetical protein
VQYSPRRGATWLNAEEALVAISESLPVVQGGVILNCICLESEIYTYGAKTDGTFGIENLLEKDETLKCGIFVVL